MRIKVILFILILSVISGVALSAPWYQEKVNQESANRVAGDQTKLIPVTLKDGTSTINLLDDTPTGEWGDTATYITTSGDTIMYKTGSQSLKIVAGNTIAAGNLVQRTLVNVDWSLNESVGFWFRTTLDSDTGDWTVRLINGTTASDLSLPPPTTVLTWEWVELDISGLAVASRDNISKIQIRCGSGGAGKNIIMWFDYMWKWDASAETDLGVDVQISGHGGAASLTNSLWSTQVEGTNYITSYVTGNDFIVSIGDLSAYSGFILVVTNDPIVPTSNVKTLIASTTRLHSTWRVTVTTINRTITSTDDVIICNGTATITMTLPAATGTGKIYFIKDVSTYSVVVDGNSSDTIDGMLTQTISSWDSIMIIDYATGKWVIL